MICSCLAADGGGSKWDMGLFTGSEPCCDWLVPSMVWDNGQLFSPASGLLMGDAWLAGAAAMGCRAEDCLGDAALGE